ARELRHVGALSVRRGLSHHPFSHHPFSHHPGRFPLTEQTETQQRPALVVDFGAQYAQLIARRVREAGMYSEIVPHTATAAEIAAKNPVALILSGGPSSVYDEGAPTLDPAVFELGVPTLGICYGFQYMAQTLGGEVANT